MFENILNIFDKKEVTEKEKKIIKLLIEGGTTIEEMVQFLKIDEQMLKDAMIDVMADALASVDTETGSTPKRAIAKKKAKVASSAAVKPIK